MKHLLFLLVALAISHFVLGAEPTHEPTYEPTHEPTHEPTEEAAPAEEVPLDDNEVMEMEFLGITGPVHDLPVPDDDDEWHYYQDFGDVEHPSPSINDTTSDAVLDEAFDDSVEARPAGFRTFEGIPNVPLGPAPPDTVGDVGPSHYVQMVNQRYAIYSKSGAVLEHPRPIDSLFPPGSVCSMGSGDPIVLYDQFVDRWLLTQFTTGCKDSQVTTCYNCIAVSQTGNPRGMYYTYAVPAQPDPNGIQGSVYPDYPKYSVWSNCYVLTTRDSGGDSSGMSYSGVSIYVFEKQPLINGRLRKFERWTLSQSTYGPRIGDGLHMLSADIDGSRRPPPGSAIPIISTQDDNFDAPFDGINVWNLFVNWKSSPATRLFLPVQLRVAPFNSNVCGLSCVLKVPLPGGQRVDSLSFALYRLAYRNFGSYESMVVVRDVQRAGPGSPIGVRWFEIRRVGIKYSVHQQGTYSPNDGVYRWMGSIAQDRVGNIVMGYSAANATTFPGIRYAGRLATDPLGVITFGGTLVTGTGTQSSNNPPSSDLPAQRWGDYSSMNIDPTDDCRFFYTNQYYSKSPTGVVQRGVQWQTKVCSFVIPSCLQRRALRNVTKEADAYIEDDVPVGSDGGLRGRTLEIDQF